MSRNGILLTLRSIFAGWTTLLLITYLFERPLLFRAAPVLGAGWYATAKLALNCCALAAAGWVAGRSHRRAPLFATAVFAATLTIRDFDASFGVNIPWLLHLMADTFRDARYLESLIGTSVIQGMLFGCLAAGGSLARPREPLTRLTSG